MGRLRFARGWISSLVRIPSVVRLASRWRTALATTAAT